jgi:hypothetical protein
MSGVELEEREDGGARGGGGVDLALVAHEEADGVGVEVKVKVLGELLVRAEVVERHATEERLVLADGDAKVADSDLDALDRRIAPHLGALAPTEIVLGIDPAIGRLRQPQQRGAPRVQRVDERGVLGDRLHLEPLDQQRLERHGAVRRHNLPTTRPSTTPDGEPRRAANGEPGAEPALSVTVLLLLLLLEEETTEVAGE